MKLNENPCALSTHLSSFREWIESVNSNNNDRNPEDSKD